MKHIVVMSLSSAIGLTALFVVDMLDLFFLSLLGEKYLAAAVGFAGSITFITTSLGIGLSIAAGALVSREIGRRNRNQACRYMVHISFMTLLVSSVVAVLTWLFIPPFLTLLGAKGQVHELAARYLEVLIPSMPLLSLSMCMNAGLRAVGDARLSMSSTLAGGAVNAVLDPIFIFLLSYHIEGAAAASVMARLTILCVSAYGILVKHSLFGSLHLKKLRKDLAVIGSIALPAVATNLAMPVSSAWIISYLSRFGDGFVAGYAIIGRIMPVAFGVVFALSGAIGPIVGQNYGARLIPRVRQSLKDAFTFTVVYVLLVSLALFLLQDLLVEIFDARRQSAQLVKFFCTWTAISFVFTGCMFVANACFNNLGKAFYSTVINWGRATLGTFPFVWLGAEFIGPTGVLLGQAAGGVVFAAVAIWLCFSLVSRIEKKVHFEAAMEKLTVPREVTLPCSFNPMSSDCALLGQMAEEAECGEKVLPEN